MTDKKTRREILEFLRAMYEEDFEIPVDDDHIAGAIGMGVSAVRASLKYLSDKNLIDVGNDSSSWVCSINANGIDELDRLELEDENQIPNISSNSNVNKSATVFISHSTDDVDLAKRIKSWLEDIGIRVFIAHQDIEPSNDFDTAIIEQVKSSIVYLALLTKNFQKSDWCDQEAGIAIATNSIILPIKIDVDPYGFLNKKQALRWNEDVSSMAILAKSIIHKLSRDEQKRIRNELLKEDGRFSRCGTYDRAGVLCNIISNFPSLTDAEVGSIAQSVIKNEQIYQSRTARPHLESILKKNQDKIPKKLLINRILSSFLR